MIAINKNCISEVYVQYPNDYIQSECNWRLVHCKGDPITIGIKIGTYDDDLFIDPAYNYKTRTEINNSLLKDLDNLDCYYKNGIIWKKPCVVYVMTNGNTIKDYHNSINECEDAIRTLPSLFIICNTNHN